MELTGAIQEALLTILCYDESYATIVPALVQPRVFDPFYRDIASKAVDFIEQYRKVPGEHTLDIVEQLQTQNPDSADVYARLYESMEETRDSLNVDYVMAKAKSFARFQRMRAGIAEALEVMQSDEDGESVVAEAEKILSSSLESTHDLFRRGTKLTDPEAFRFLDDDYPAFPCGIEEIDKRGLGPARKRLHVFAALPGKGKSWWLVHQAKQALLQGLKVVYVTLELSETEVLQRVMQSFFSVSKRKVRATRPVFETDELGRFTRLESMVVKGRPALSDDGIKGLLEKKISKLRGKDRFIVREFPTGALSVKELSAYLDQLEASEKFIPDILLVDYADIMRVDAANYRHALGTVYKDLRGIAVERNIAVATATQMNREALSSKLANEGNVSEDFSKVMTCDTLLTFNQTQDEKELGLARLFVAKGRTDEDKFTVLISQAYSLGQFCLQSARMVSSYWQRLTEADREEDSDE